MTDRELWRGTQEEFEFHNARKKSMTQEELLESSLQASRYSFDQAVARKSPSRLTDEAVVFQARHLNDNDPKIVHCVEELDRRGLHDHVQMREGKVKPFFDFKQSGKNLAAAVEALQWLWRLGTPGHEPILEMHPQHQKLLDRL